MKATVIKRLNKRNHPSAEGNIPLPYPHEPGDIIEVVEEVKGSFHGNPPTDRWLKTDRGYYVWSGGVSFDFVLQPLSIKNSVKKTNSDFQNEINIRMKNGNLNYYELTNISDHNSSGTGVAIAIFDVGINKSHNVLVDKFKSVEAPTKIIHPHGTQIAGLIGASRRSNFTGISPDANLLDCGMFDKKGFRKDKFEEALKTIRELKKDSNLKGIIANISFNLTSDIDFLTESIEKLSNEIVIVASAGEARVGINELAAERTLQFPAILKNVIAVGAIESEFPRHGNLSFNGHLKYLVPNFSYWSCTNKSNEDFSLINNDSAATAIVSGLISNLISSGTLGDFPSANAVVNKLNEYAVEINTSSILSNFNLYRP